MSHEDAKRRDARTVLSPGEKRTAVIIETDVDDDGTGLTKIENIKTFVHPGKTSFEFTDTVQVKITDVGDSHAEAVALATVD